MDELVYCLSNNNIRTNVEAKIMCEYTQVEYHCGHRRYLVLSWCKAIFLSTTASTRFAERRCTGMLYQETHKRCPPNIVAVEHRLEERCGESVVLVVHSNGWSSSPSRRLSETATSTTSRQADQQKGEILDYASLIDMRSSTECQSRCFVEQELDQQFQLDRLVEGHANAQPLLITHGQ